jgi:NADH/NAD ratio-sensing transcriptional regulator Rex
LSSSLILGILTAIIGSGGIGAAISAWVAHKRNGAQSETEARAQFTAEFSTTFDKQSQILDRLDKEVQHLRSEIAALRIENHRSELYVDLLITGIANGTVPPIPDRREVLDIP